MASLSGQPHRARIARGVKYIASDDHAGLKAACKAMFPGVPRRRCQFHLQHNARGYDTKLDQRTMVARQIRVTFNAGDAQEAQRLLNVALKDWQGNHPQLATWAETNVPEGFAVFNLPEGQRVRMRTTNGLERLNKNLKRRTRVATLFPNPESCERLVSAMLADHFFANTSLGGRGHTGQTERGREGQAQKIAHLEVE